MTDPIDNLATLIKADPSDAYLQGYKDARSGKPAKPEKVAGEEEEEPGTDLDGDGDSDTPEDPGDSAPETADIDPQSDEVDPADAEVTGPDDEAEEGPDVDAAPGDEEAMDFEAGDEGEDEGEPDAIDDLDPGEEGGDEEGLPEDNEELPDDGEELPDDGDNHDVGDLDEDGQEQSIAQEVANLEKLYYAAKGFHGAGSKKAEAALDLFHRAVRKMARAAMGANGGEEEGAPPRGDSDDDSGEPSRDSDDDSGDSEEDAPPRGDGDDSDDEKKKKVPPQFAKKSFDALDDLEPLYKTKYKSRKRVKGKWVYEYEDKKSGKGKGGKGKNTQLGLDFSGKTLDDPLVVSGNGTYPAVENMIKLVQDGETPSVKQVAQFRRTIGALAAEDRDLVDAIYQVLSPFPAAKGALSNDPGDQMDPGQVPKGSHVVERGDENVYFITPSGERGFTKPVQSATWQPGDLDGQKKSLDPLDDLDSLFKSKFTRKVKTSKGWRYYYDKAVTALGGKAFTDLPLREAKPMPEGHRRTQAGEFSAKVEDGKSGIVFHPVGGRPGGSVMTHYSHNPLTDTTKKTYVVTIGGQEPFRVSSREAGESYFSVPKEAKKSMHSSDLKVSDNLLAKGAQGLQLVDHSPPRAMFIDDRRDPFEALAKSRQAQRERLFRQADPVPQFTVDSACPFHGNAPDAVYKSHLIQPGYMKCTCGS